MRLLVLPVLLLLACSSGSLANPDPDHYLVRVREMHAEYKERFGYLTRVTLAVRPQPEAPGPTPTIKEWKQEVVAGLAVRLADLSRVNSFQREGLAELRAMAVPEEHRSLHTDLTELWEAGISWTDRWVVVTREAIGGIQGEDWGKVGFYTDEEMAAYAEIHARHADAWGRVDFVLWGTPLPPPYDIPGSATAWALTPFPEIPTATLGPSPTPRSGSAPTGEYVDLMDRKDTVMRFADDACGPEKLEYQAFDWPELAGEISWAVVLLNHDIPRGLGGFRDVLWDYYDTLKTFAEKQDRALKVDEALFMSDRDVLQKRMAVVTALEALSEPDQAVEKNAAYPAGNGAPPEEDVVGNIPGKAQLKYPNLGSQLNSLVVQLEEGAGSTRDAEDGAGVQVDGSIAVTVHLSGNVEDVVGFLENNGGDPRNVGEDYIEAYVPVSLLGKLSEQPGVLRVREIISPKEDR